MAMDGRRDAGRQGYGPDDALYAALRRGAPQMGVKRIDRPACGSAVFITYQDRPAVHVGWDVKCDAYAWQDGPDAGTQISRDPEDAAELIAHSFGAVYSRA
ncbi:hypothetical protein [Actinomadura fibrosa]|uniref:Uncharacterized protein n=1 Tax=Actinomadura fibrosa TaxID=111802 RepID=A0ABW2XHU7_9ACTN|nr:hypothetical protein [Actinomadura fibrosa]